jgi:HemY protein
VKIGLIVILALIASAFAAYFLLSEPSYVIISFRGHLVEMSVPVLVLLTAAMFACVWLIRKIMLTPRRLGEATAMRSVKKMTRGMIEVAEGNLARGERLLARAAGTSGAPLFNYLQAARAAHLQGRHDRRDDWLKLAYQKVPEAANAVLLTQAEFQLDQGQDELALATLRRLDENSKGQGHALTLLSRLYFRLEDWESLREILPRVRKHAQIKPATLALWTIRVNREQIDNAADGEALTAAWKEVPKPQKSDLTLLEAYYRGLMRTGQSERAEKELISALKSDWRGPLVRIFGQVEGPDASKQLNKAETWLSTHSDDPDLLLTAAQLCLRNELWGKARSYLETVISLRPTPEAYQEYGALLNQIGDTDAAADAYRDGLGMLAGNNLPAIEHIKQ